MVLLKTSIKGRKKISTVEEFTSRRQLTGEIKLVRHFPCPICPGRLQCTENSCTVSTKTSIEDRKKINTIEEVASRRQANRRN